MERGIAYMPEKILIIAVKRQDQTDDHFQSTIDELISLSHTAGGEVEEVMTQNRNHIHPATYIGRGKMNEITQKIDESAIDLVISNDELSPGQIRNLSDAFGIQLIDRSQLILDIFAKRAHTKEGKLQVELAQLEYLLPRLHGQGVALSRLGGGIGTRGPGETKLETDRRHIRRKIHDIKRQLSQVVRNRDQYRKRRKANNVFQISIVGYTNAGKSTLFNNLTKSDAYVENQLFATLDPLTRKVKLPSGFEALFTDTVGFLQDLPTTLIAAFRSTLEEVKEADFILHVVDAHHPDEQTQQATVIDLLNTLDAESIPMLTVYNKKDLISEETFIPSQHPYTFMSALSEVDSKMLLQTIENVLKDEWNWFSAEIDPANGKALHDIQQHTILTEQKFNPTNNNYIVNGYIRDNDPLYDLLKEQPNQND